MSMVARRAMWSAMAFLAGGTVGWYAHREPDLRIADQSSGKDTSAPVVPRSSSTLSDPPASRDQEPSVETSPIRPAERRSLAPREAATVVRPPGDPTQLFRAGNLPNDSSTNLTNELKALHSAYRVSCTFDSGINAQIGDGVFTTTSASWQGGTIIYDVIDAAEGRATMSGTAGATGSATGTVEVRMAGTNAAVNFSGLVPRGDLISTTIFAARNTRGEYLAVMSTHAAGNASMASQFYGACDVR
jgi:hypothetical protein